MSRHQDQTANHIAESWTFTNRGNLNLGTGVTFVSGDAGRIAITSDTNQYWRNLSTTPTWQEVSSGFLEYRVTGSNATTTGQTLADITGLVTTSGDLAVSTIYFFEAVLLCTSSSAAGCQYGVNCTVAPTTVNAEYFGEAAANTSAISRSSANNTAEATAFLTASQTAPVFIRGWLQTAAGAGPVFSIRHLKVTSGTATVNTSSVLRIRRMPV